MSDYKTHYYGDGCNDDHGRADHPNANRDYGDESDHADDEWYDDYTEYATRRSAQGLSPGTNSDSDTVRDGDQDGDGGNREETPAEGGERPDQKPPQSSES